MTATVFVAGRYNKFARNISQTPWLLDGDKKIADSVEGFIVESLQLFLRFRRESTERREHSWHERASVDRQKPSSWHQDERTWMSRCWVEEDRLP